MNFFRRHKHEIGDEASGKVIRPNKIKIEEIPNIAELLSSPKDAIRHLVHIDEKYVHHVKAETDEKIIRGFMHPFAQAVHLAYCHHVPLIITPDVIWYMISSAIAIHINKNAELLRKVFVDHEGKKKLIVRRNDLDPDSPDCPWNEVIEMFTVEINKNTNNNVVDLLVPTFTTTTACARVVSQIVLMDAKKSYFDYSCMTMCGIPEIRLVGTKQDWELIKSKAKDILKLMPDMNVWIDGCLGEILDQFTSVFDGKVDKKFWNEIYKSSYCFVSYFEIKFKLITAQTFICMNKHNTNELDVKKQKDRIKIFGIPLIAFMVSYGDNAIMFSNYFYLKI